MTWTMRELARQAYGHALGMSESTLGVPQRQVVAAKRAALVAALPLIEAARGTEPILASEADNLTLDHMERALRMHIERCTTFLDRPRPAGKSAPSEPSLIGPRRWSMGSDYEDIDVAGRFGL